MIQDAERISEIELRLRIIEDKARALSKNRLNLEKVEKLAGQQTDPVYAKFFRDRGNPEEVSGVVNNIRERLHAGQIDDAQHALRRLETELLYVEQEVKRPILKK